MSPSVWKEPLVCVCSWSRTLSDGRGPHGLSRVGVCQGQFERRTLLKEDLEVSFHLHDDRCEEHVLHTHTHTHLSSKPALLSVLGSPAYPSPYLGCDVTHGLADQTVLSVLLQHARGRLVYMNILLVVLTVVGPPDSPPDVLQQWQSFTYGERQTPSANSGLQDRSHFDETKQIHQGFCRTMILAEYILGRCYWTELSQHLTALSIVVVELLIAHFSTVTLFSGLSL